MIDDLVCPILRRAALRNEQKILDHLPHGQRLRDGYDAGHRLASPDPLVRVCDQGVETSCVKTTRPSDTARASTVSSVVATKTEVLHAHQIGLRDTSQKASDEVIVEVLVDQEANHAGLDEDRLARSRARMPPEGSAASNLPRTAAAASWRRLTYASTSPR